MLVHGAKLGFGLHAPPPLRSPQQLFEPWGTSGCGTRCSPSPNALSAAGARGRGPQNRFARVLEAFRTKNMLGFLRF